MSELANQLDVPPSSLLIAVHHPLNLIPDFSTNDIPIHNELELFSLSFNLLPCELKVMIEDAHVFHEIFSRLKDQWVVHW
jgi:hypothetical protein